MPWNKPLPNVESWQPKVTKDATLRNSLMITCQVAQARIVTRAKVEIEFKVQNFDSGLGTEEIVREELVRLMPNRYSVSPGLISDRQGRTAGDCDLIVRDPNWSSVIKPGASSESRRFHFPIEGVYAVTEIKQTLGRKELDAAMEKLVVVNRLERLDNPYGHITENQHIKDFDRKGTILNPLHTTVFATRIPKRSTFDDMVKRFGEINAKLNRNDMVKMLCVLDQGTAWYSVESGNPFNANYMTDRGVPLIMQISRKEPENAFYRYYVEILGHLTRSVLSLHDLTSAYGEPPPFRDICSYPDAAFNKDEA